MIEGLDYVYEYPRNDSGSIYVRLISGHYTDTLFKYGKVSVDTDTDPDEARLNFEYKVIESKVENPRKLQKDLVFKKILGEFLIQIITTATEAAVIEDEDVLDEFGTDNSQESYS